MRHPTLPTLSSSPVLKQTLPCQRYEIHHPASIAVRRHRKHTALIPGCLLLSFQALISAYSAPAHGLADSHPHPLYIATMQLHTPNPPVLTRKCHVQPTLVIRYYNPSHQIHDKTPNDMQHHTRRLSYRICNATTCPHHPSSPQYGVYGECHTYHDHGECHAYHYHMSCTTCTHTPPLSLVANPTYPQWHPIDTTISPVTHERVEL